MSILFQKIKVGDIEVPNRIIMAPLTRCRASSGRVANELMARYYEQRSSAGIIISEATSINPMGVGYPDTPGIWNEEQIESWKLVTKKIHESGGKIFLQLWHVGRVSDPYYLNGNIPVAPSAIKPNGHVNLIRPIKEFVVPRVLTIKEIRQIINDYKNAAINSKKANFDGVEIHGANGYLIDQFLQDSTNLRCDDYGGSLENRARFMLDIVDAIIPIWGSNRIGMHLSPGCDKNSMSDSDPVATFTYVAKELSKRNLAFIFSREATYEKNVSFFMRKEFSGLFIINQDLDKHVAENMLDNDRADLVSFGRLFISNPDLVYRLKNNLSLNKYDTKTFYFGKEKGYIDYPFYHNDIK